MKRILSILTLVAGALVASATSASAHIVVPGQGSLGYVFNCSSSTRASAPWKMASWGRAQTVVYRAYENGPAAVVCGNVDDTLTDGFCVHMEGKTQAGAWVNIPNQSCGPVTAFSHSANSRTFLTVVRLVRGPCICNGIGVNYLTIWTQ